MARYHINDRGEPGLCRALQTCPFGSEKDHHASAAGARQAYEQKHSTQLTKALEKAGPSSDSHSLTLDLALAEARSEYESLSVVEGWIESKLRSTVQAQESLDRLAHGTAARHEALRLRNWHRERLLAANVVATEAAASSDLQAVRKLATDMVQVEQTRSAVDFSLERALEKKDYVELARAARTRPESVAAFLRFTQKEYAHPRFFRRGTLTDLAKNSVWASQQARRLGCQSKDIENFLKTVEATV